MNREEAKTKLEQGKKISHIVLSDSAYVYSNGGFIYDESGCKIKADVFWKIYAGLKFYDGWFEVPDIENLTGFQDNKDVKDTIMKWIADIDTRQIISADITYGYRDKTAFDEGFNPHLNSRTLDGSFVLIVKGESFK